jgi:cobalamin-dependent methionine synthase I
LRKILSYKPHEIEPYINWLYFFHAWGLSGKPADEQEKLREEAAGMLSEMENQCQVFALFSILDANSDGDDIVIGKYRLPMLRQQKTSQEPTPNLCLADFLRPLSSGIKDKIGLFATSTSHQTEDMYRDDPFKKMLVQTLADRLAEAAAERMHEEVRRIYWGYAPDEHLTMEELHWEKFQGIRPAVGYPSLPDTSINFLLDQIIGMKDIGIRLTENGMMMPHASVSGLMMAHPQAHYFDLGKIGEDQLADYARRRGVPVVLMRRFLSSNLLRV